MTVSNRCLHAVSCIAINVARNSFYIPLPIFEIKLQFMALYIFVRAADRQLCIIFIGRNRNGCVFVCLCVSVCVCVCVCV